ncbi:hypothetical protein JCM10295v2_001273 [Rhodotorula toruloides]
MSLASLVPQVDADSAQTRSLLPWGFYCTLFARPDSDNTTPTPWNAEIEAYYQMGHPTAWSILRQDDSIDTCAWLNLETRIKSQEREQGTIEDDDGATEAARPGDGARICQRAASNPLATTLDIVRSQFLTKQLPKPGIEDHLD